LDLETTGGLPAGFGGRAVTASELRAWSKQAGFMAWLLDMVPESDPLSDTDLRVVDARWLQGVTLGMQSGEEWAYREYAKFRFQRQETGGTPTRPVADGGIDGFLEAGNAEAWTVEKGGGEA
jgi:hypothetical protein